MSESGDRQLLVDASAFITLADVGATDYLYDASGRIAVPEAVSREITEDPADSALDRAVEGGVVAVVGPATPEEGEPESYLRAMEHLGRSLPTPEGKRHWRGDVALLGEALSGSDSVVVSDDEPVRETCKALSIPLSGSIGVLVRAVERGDATAADAEATLEAMDEVGARLSASLLRRGEALIAEAAEDA